MIWRLREQLKAFAQAVVTRVADPSTDFALTREGLEVKSRLGRNEDDLESVQNDLQQIKFLLAEQNSTAPVASPAAASTDQIDLLQEKAKQYMEVKHEQWGERVRLKNQIVQEMTSTILRQGISRDALAESRDEGIVIALANTIHMYPLPGDVDRLLKIADRSLERLHVKYRIAMAIGRLCEDKLLAPRHLDPLREVLRRYREDAIRRGDPSLQKRSERTLELLDSYERDTAEGPE